MKRWAFFVLFAMLFNTNLSAQTPPALSSTSQIGWDITGPTITDVRSWSYRHYDDNAATGTTFPTVTCSGTSSPFLCQAAFTSSMFTPGTHTTALEAFTTNPAAVSGKSATITFTVPSPSPTIPMNPRIFGSLRLLFDGRLFLTYEDPDQQAVELGMKFRTSVPGLIAGVSFHKTINNTGIHIGNLWTMSGNQLASVTFRNETATGWQWAMFPSPVAIQPSTTYIISYFAPRGHYTALEGGFSQPAVNGVLYAPADGEDGPNGVYTYSSSSTFPFQSYQATNYWVDVLFAPV